MSSAVEAPPALVVRSVSKTFGAVRALREVSFEVSHGRIHALLGGNGSGKSTLIKILAGVYQADPGGRVELDGETVAADGTNPEEARAHGLRFVHQNPGLFPDLTIADNVALTSSYPTRFGGIDKRALHRRTRALLEAFRIDARPGQLLGELRPADQTMVAVARALERREGEPASLLVLDEPTASLPDEEVEVLLAALRRQADAGQGIVYVSHRIDEVLGIADDVTVLRDGVRVVTRPVEGLDEASLSEYIAGRPVESMFGDKAAATEIGDPVLEVRGLCGGPLREASFTLRAGEILGIAGLLGSGRTELLRLLFGADRAEAGTMRLDGVDQDLPASPAEAMRRGMAFVPEDRAVEAAFASMSVTHNVTLSRLPDHTRLGRLDGRAERASAWRAIEQYGIRPGRDDVDLATLSGGNQQKVVLARWQQRSPRVLLLDEPTQGVDVGARADIYAAIREATRAGLGVLLVSSDLEELAHASDRVLVLRAGRLDVEARPDQLNRADLTALAYSTHLPAPVPAPTSESARP